MEALSQLDVQNPDHVSVITRDGKMTVSVIKDGAAVTVTMPIRNLFDTSPRPQLQQPELKPYKALVTKEVTAGETREAFIPTSKLNESQVREIKMMLSDKDLMARMGSRTNAFNEIGKAYEVSGCTISNIARGISWKHVKV